MKAEIETDALTQPVKVETGRADGTNAEILSGLSEGDTVYYKYSGSLEYTFVNR